MTTITDLSKLGLLIKEVAVYNSDAYEEVKRVNWFDLSYEEMKELADLEVFYANIRTDKKVFDDTIKLSSYLVVAVKQQ